MKRTALLLFLLLFSARSYSQFTPASVEGVSPGRNTTFKNPISDDVETRFIGLCFGKIYNPNSGPDVCFYSIDVIKAASFCMPNFDYVDDPNTVLDFRVCYMLRTYYPGATGPGQLSNLNNETAAIQLVIWHYTNGLDLNTITSTTVKNRALAIKAYVDANGTSCSPNVTFEIVMDADPEYFLVRTTNDNGSGIAVSNIQLSISEGTLSQYTVNTTAPDGYSVPVQVTGTAVGVITAVSNNIVMPKGTVFRHSSDQCPKVVLACPGPGEKRISVDWGALPVELTSFTSAVSGNNVELSWTTSSELNNSHFEIERRARAGEWTTAGRVSGNGTIGVPVNYTFTDRGLASGRYEYRLKQVDFNGNFEYFNLANEVELGVPAQFSLSQNYPNPFNPETKIRFDMKNEGFVSIKVFDFTGKEVAALVNGFMPAGYHTVSFNAGNSGLSSGIYFYRMETGGFVKVLKMTLLK
ncbi:MAG: T9SS type A sorting domain-containing protein [Ignavibacteria bacterium]|nr:T9SS type A sorting domain-containing protein [Ignavibacteria bacterium]